MEIFIGVFIFALAHFNLFQFDESDNLYMSYHEMSLIYLILHHKKVAFDG